MLQARRLGKELLVGIHSDEEIMDNKGPTVMTLQERWGTWSIGEAMAELGLTGDLTVGWPRATRAGGRPYRCHTRHT